MFDLNSIAAVKEQLIIAKHEAMLARSFKLDQPFNQEAQVMVMLTAAYVAQIERILKELYQKNKKPTEDITPGRL